MSIIIPAIAAATKRNRELGVGGTSGAQSICPSASFCSSCSPSAGSAWQCC
jgi:hypothetical protein